MVQISWFIVDCYFLYGKIPLGRPRRRWQDNIRMNLEEIDINAGIGLIRLRIGIIGEPL